MEVGSGAEFQREEFSLNGKWWFQREGAKESEWKEVAVPSSFQTHEGVDFHGVGYYRRDFDFPPPAPGKRVLLEFSGAATEAEVWCDGVRLGSHLGAWTPFRFDITAQLKAGSKAHQLRVRLDEKVGHNTQGFLPIIEPHFGGLWQGVSLLVVPDHYVNDLEVMAVGDWRTKELRLEFPLVGSETERGNQELRVRSRLRGQQDWTELTPVTQVADGKLFIRCLMPEARAWTPAEPNLYEVEIALGGKNGDRIQTRTAFRRMEAVGPQFRLNGQVVNIRGLLNWGYSPPMLEPNPGEAAWRQELEFARERGFNLMKFCLWIPPRRYLELADEMGMMTWMEYPTWHPNFTEKYREPLLREFQEFFLYDRNHPSVVLRSLTCETGPSADLKILKNLYDKAHEMIPGALVEDDSSWIGWNRIHDFYDDHPYGNNHTWVATLTGFNDYILAHGLKPLVLGETTSADTWVDRDALLARLGTDRPWWAPQPLDAMAAWTARMRELAGPDGLENLLPDSLHYGLLMRKYQIEAFRREVPYGGYVISVIRDVPNASMGLLDYLGRPKWSAEEWAWHRDTICLLKTEDDRRSFFSGEQIKGKLLLSHFGAERLENGQLEVTLEEEGAQPRVVERLEKKEIDQNVGTLAELATVSWPAPQLTQPGHLTIRAVVRSGGRQWQNEWPIWAVPKPETGGLTGVELHSSVATDLAADLFPGCPRFVGKAQGQVVVASRMDDVLASFLESGGRVLFLPDGQRYSFPLKAHWFLRGAPYIPSHPVNKVVPRDLLVELQHFDLASDVVPNLAQLEACDPILLLWDTHDSKTVQTHGLVFETRVGKGRLLVSALRHNGAGNAAGSWLLSELIEHLRSGEPPKHTLPDKVWEYQKARLHAEQTNLVSCVWQFRPDPKDIGLQEGWQTPSVEAGTEWKEIRIGAWWESQGYPALDGWAWYRLWVDIPQRWEGKNVLLSFEGVDDIYELYVNGKLAGKGGDLATRKDALSEKKSHDISALVKPGQRALIAVRVYDWYGAGGIFRPVTLGTLPFDDTLDWLK